MIRNDHIRKIDREYDKIVVSISGGKDSVGCLIFADQHFDKCKIEALWVDLEWDHPEIYPYMIWLIWKFDIKLNIIKIPTPLKKIAPSLGYLAHKHRWCGPEGKFMAITNFFDSLPKQRLISFEGTRRAESRARSTRNYFSDASESFTSYPTYRPVLEMSNISICNYCAKNGFPLLPLYRTNDRVGCYMCPEQNLQGWAVLRQFYPNLFQKFLKFLKLSMYHADWKEKYASDMITKIFKHTITNDNFKVPYTAGFTNDSIIEKDTGILFKDVRDDPDYTFERALQQCDLPIDVNFFKPPSPDRHRDWIRFYEESVAEGDKI